MRSGRLAMGDFVSARRLFAHGGSAYDAAESFFYVIPTSSRLTSARVTFSPVSGGGKTTTVTTRQHEEAAQWTYYPVHVKLTPGVWRLTAVSGTDRGCFLLHLTA
ncbi:hypothetical protein D9V37_15700 [Nocardioides mangrovicus]|uniref:Uncharacterized protein n=1 Tax=Nocardioides mangrovicus TaxID=2478913 RepID=A0A3L8NYA1_9ACTN|nr:hypothetical protein D9V37_15700 [Nocardioides mangrovicus]